MDKRSPIRAKEWSGRAELTNYLLNASKRNILLNDAAEAARRFYSFAFNDERGLPIEIGLVMSFFGIPPEAVLTPRREVLLIGYDQSIAVIDVRDLRAVEYYQLNGPFYEFIQMPTIDRIVAVYELGLIAFDGTGQQVWTRTLPNVVTGTVPLGRKRITVSVDESKASIVVDAGSGKTVQKS